MTLANRPGLADGAHRRSQNFMVPACLSEQRGDIAAFFFINRHQAVRPYPIADRQLDFALFPPLGLPERKPANPEVLTGGIARWRQWYASLYIAVDPSQEFDEP